MKKKLIIAVDGHSSCGKSTFAKAIAEEMGYIYVDSGAMYRAVTLYCLRNNLVNKEGIKRQEIINRLNEISIRFKYNPDRQQQDTYLNGENVEEEIRSVRVSSSVSPVSEIKEVRDRLVVLQREIGVYKGIVMDGRDIGTVVFPDAEIKIFLTASEKIRAERRYRELLGKGIDVDFGQVLQNISDRDRIDSSRAISPLKKAEDAYLLDNSEMSVNEQMVWFRDLLKKKWNED